MTTIDRAKRVLVVEDEAHLAAGLELNLGLEGYDVRIAATARAAREHVRVDGPFDAIVLDVMLPDEDGFALCRSLRAAHVRTPVIMLTAKSSAEDRVRGLDAGADDYLPKPFELAELLARLRSLMRRSAWDGQGESARSSANGATRPPARPPVTIGRGRVDFDQLVAHVDGGQQPLTRLEVELIGYLVDHPARVLTREELLDKVWGLANYPNTRTVDNFIVRLRRMFEHDPQRPQHILSVRGFGYKFVPDPR